MPFSDDNPFATGGEGAPLGVPASVADDGTAPVDLDLGAIAARVGENVQRHGVPTAVVVGILVALVVVMIPIGMFVGVGSAILVVGLGLPEEISNLTSFVTSSAQALLTSLLMVGAYRMFLTGARGQEPQLSMLVQELWATVKLFIAQLLVLMATSVLLLPAVGAGVAWHYGYLQPMEALAVAGANVALVMPVSLVISVFTQFLGVILVDQQLGPIAALVECVRVTRGGRLLAAAFMVVIGMVAGVVGLFTCGFGAPVVQVLGAWVHVVMYRAMVAKNGRSPSSMVSDPI